MSQDARHHALSFVLLAAVTLVLPGCKQEKQVDEVDAAFQIATAYCDQLYACKCVDSAGFSSKEACRATVSGDLAEQQAVAVMNALVYDPGCVADLQDEIESLACARDPDEAASCRSCFSYHGLLPESSRCERFGSFSNCDQGLECVVRQDNDGEPIDVCSPACLRVPAHEPCAFGGPGFQILYDCEEGSVCDAESTGYCFPLPGPGAPCANGGICGVDAWCDAENDPPICASLKNAGDGCSLDVECESTWCRLETRCAEPLGSGDPCIFDTDRCEVGLFCPPDYPFCIPTDAIVCQVPPVTL